MSSLELGAFCLGLVTGIFLMFGLYEFVVGPRQGKIYDQLWNVMDREREHAKAESKLYRNLLFPVMARAEGAAADPQQVTKASPAEVQRGPRSAAPSKPALPEPKSVEEIWAMRIPYREKFKLLMRFTNSKQRRTDALASALTKQKPIPSQEKQNA